MTELNKEQQADCEHAIDMAQDLIEKMGDTWDGADIEDIIFSIGVAVDALCTTTDFPQELANDIISITLTDDDSTESELTDEDDDHMEVISLDEDDSIEFLKHLLSKKDNN
jgi:hypothetical protein